MAKINCAGGCGQVRDLELLQKGAKDVGYTISPKYWLCEKCKAQKVPPAAIESRPRPVSQAVDPNVAFTFIPPSEAKKAPAPPPSQEPATEDTGEGAKTDDPKPSEAKA